MKITKIHISVGNGFEHSNVTDTITIPTDEWNDLTQEQQLDLILEHIRDDWSITWRTNENL